MTDQNIIGFDVDRNGDAAIVVAVQRDGSYTVRADRVCKILAAELLRGIADRLVAEHGNGLCTPEPAQQRPREDEAADPYSGRLDRDRRVWRDPRGDSWDLTLTWADWTEREWKWHGTTGQFGEPILRCDDGEAQPLGVLRALYGPITPVMGGAA
ncbi:phiSA1p31-related protein [Streptomyces sp. NPDC051133]|uniref:phiSA1p31-related protein n=1 Tax=Streptomyces sp. NPDC051133 TaxID=3155521 RepID=UPI003440A487